MALGRWLNAALAAANALLLARLLFKPRHAWSWIDFWALLVLVSYGQLTTAYAHVFSEPLYLTWMMLAILALYDDLRGRARGKGPLIRAACFSALACLTRY